VHHEHARGHLAHEPQVVRDEQAREAALARVGAQDLGDLALHRDVERRRDLVADEHARRERERTRDRDALPLAARELVRIARRGVGREPHALELARDPAGELGSGREPVHREPFADDLRHAAARIERARRILEHDRELAPQRAHLAGAEREEIDRKSAVAVVAHAAAARFDEPQGRAPERALARPRPPHQRDDLAACELERGLRHGPQLAARAPQEPALQREAHVEIADFEHRLGHRRCASSR
jgi:hypothetical protein